MFTNKLPTGTTDADKIAVTETTVTPGAHQPTPTTIDHNNPMYDILKTIGYHHE